MRDSIVPLQNCDCPTAGIHLYLLLNGLFDRVVILFKINVDILAKVPGFKRIGWIYTENIPPLEFFLPRGDVRVDFGIEITADILAYGPVVSENRLAVNFGFVITVPLATVDV